MKQIITIVLFAFIAASGLRGQTAVERLKARASENDLLKAANLIPQAYAEDPKNLNNLLLFGDIYFELEKLDSALIMYRKADDVDGGEPNIMRKIGKTLSYMEKHEEAVEILKEALEEDEKDVYSMLELAYAYLRLDSLDDAEVLITRARENNKDMAEPYVALGDLYFAQRVYLLAQNNYEEALQIEPNLLDARIKLAQSYYWLATRERKESELKSELYNRSLQEWNKVTKTDPNNARAFFEQGKILFLSSQYQPAAQSLYKYIQLRPDGIKGRWMLAQSLYEVKQCDSAAEHLEIVARQVKEVRTLANLYLARCYFGTEDFSRSAMAFNQIARDTTLDFTDLQRFAGALFKSGDTLASLDVYKQTIDQYPDNSCGLIKKVAVISYTIKNFDQAAEYYRKMHANENCEEEADNNSYFLLGLCYFFAERPDSLKMYTLDSAKTTFKEYLKRDSTSVQGYVFYGDALSSLDLESEAREAFEKGADIGIEAIKNGDPDSTRTSKLVVQAFSKLAGILYEKKDYKELIRVSKKWYDFSKESASPAIYAAVSYQLLGENENACVWYRNALRIDPKNKTAIKYKNQLGC